MSEHVETLKKVRKLLQNTPALQGREHIGLGIAFNDAIDHFSAPTQNDELIAEIQRIDGIRQAIGGTPEIAEMYRDACVALLRNPGKLIAALSKPVAPISQPPTFTTGHCENRKHPGGCQLHNVHCGYPNCDRREVQPDDSVQVTDAMVERGVAAYQRAWDAHEASGAESMAFSTLVRAAITAALRQEVGNG